MFQLYLPTFYVKSIVPFNSKRDRNIFWPPSLGSVSPSLPTPRLRLGLSSSANMLKIADVALRVVFLLFLPCFSLLFCLVPAVALTLETREMSAFFFFYNQNISTSSPGLLGKGGLTWSGLYFWRHFLVKHKILPNLVISNWLWWIMRVLCHILRARYTRTQVNCHVFLRLVM